MVEYCSWVLVVTQYEIGAYHWLCGSYLSQRVTGGYACERSDATPRGPWGDLYTAVLLGSDPTVETAARQLINGRQRMSETDTHTNMFKRTHPQMYAPSESK